VTSTPPSEPERDDGTLALQALAGGKDAYRVLMRRHRDPVYRFVHGQIGDGDAALDVVQESFVAAFANLHRYDRTRPFRFWILRIALNKCRDWRRRRAVRGFFVRARPLKEGVEVRDEAPGAEAELIARSELRRARIFISQLPENLRTVLLLRTIERMSQTEVATLLGISEKAVETRLYRARAKLAEAMRGDDHSRV
jgi:RNA polymerase sigma factor CnrH